MCSWPPEEFHQLGTGDLKHVRFDAFLDRLKIASGANNYEEPAEWLGVRQSHISDAKRRNIVPVEWLRTAFVKRSGFHPVWILTGEKPMLWGDH